MLISDFSQLQWLPAILLFFLPLFRFLLVLKKNNRNLGSKFELPPSPPKLPIFGHLHLLGNLPHRSLENLSQRYGPVMLLQLGSVPNLIISSAKMAKEFLKTHDIDCCTRPASPGGTKFSYNGLDVAFSPYGDYWKEMRKLFITELLSMKRVQSFAYARESEVGKLITSLSQSSPKPVNLDERIYALADGIIVTVAFGKIYGTDHFKNQAFQNVLGEATNMLASFSAEDFFPRIGRFVDAVTGFNARLEKSFYEFDAYLQMVLNQHLDPARPRPDHEDLVDVLVGLLNDQSSTFRLTENNVKAMLFFTRLEKIPPPDTCSKTERECSDVYCCSDCLLTGIHERCKEGLSLVKRLNNSLEFFCYDLLSIIEPCQVFELVVTAILFVFQQIHVARRVCGKLKTGTVGPGNVLGKTIDVNDVVDHIFGLVLMNNRRDKPREVMGFNQHKVVLSPWIVILDALKPFSRDAPKQDPHLLPYLAEMVSQNYNIALEHIPVAAKENAWKVLVGHGTLNGVTLRERLKVSASCSPI
ncbi:Cytochrome P450 [Corchorus olitorius]|uniref:Cytochrome P450 n=1 Tax=Corchorus olitorius TaxID=93759 RepID=A0A1R3HSC6_9ROSI|nr:Cytochrome P450 [Corchorus olitorius]